MRRIYFLIPNINVTHKVVAEPHSQDIEDNHIHILGILRSKAYRRQELA